MQLQVANGDIKQRLVQGVKLQVHEVLMHDMNYLHPLAPFAEVSQR